jgi:hypothetical protein
VIDPEAQPPVCVRRDALAFDADERLLANPGAPTATGGHRYTSASDTALRGIVF